MTPHGGKDKIIVLSIHWGFLPGGIGKYALAVDRMNDAAPISIKSAVILNRAWQTDFRGVETLDAEKVQIRSRYDFSWILEIIHIIKRERPDLVMSHGFNGHFVSLASKTISRHDIPLICSYHGRYHGATAARKLVEKPLNLFTEYFIRSKAIGVAAVSEHTKQYLMRRGVPGAKVEVIHNGIPPLDPNPIERNILRSDWGAGPDGILIGTASRLDPIKGIDFLIDAIGILSGKHPNLLLVIIGTGPLADHLNAKVHHMGLSEKVLFAGFRSDVPDCLHALDIFVLPSLAENHSIGLLEAMRAGKAIVATDVGGNTESVRDGNEGFIVPPADAERLARAIELFIDNPSLRNAMGTSACERFALEFTEDKMVRKTASWITECAGSRAALNH